MFLSTNEQPIAYGVLALSQPFEELVGPYPPVLTETALLPFKGLIVYDGLMTGYRISFGAGIRRSLNENFKEAKARHGIVTPLPVSDESLPVKAPSPITVHLGVQEGVGFVVRALISGRLEFEDNKAGTLAEAMAAREKGPVKWFKQEGIEVE